MPVEINVLLTFLSPVFSFRRELSCLFLHLFLTFIKRLEVGVLIFKVALKFLSRKYRCTIRDPPPEFFPHDFFEPRLFKVLKERLNL